MKTAILAWALCGSSCLNAHSSTNADAASQENLFGAAITEIGDIDGDGCRDIVVGCPLDSTHALRQGAVFCLSGQSGRLLRVVEGKYRNAHFGSRMGLINDINGNGISDVLVFASGGDVPGLGYMVILDGQSLRELSSLSADVDESFLGQAFAWNPSLGVPDCGELVFLSMKRSLSRTNDDLRYAVTAIEAKSLQRVWCQPLNVPIESVENQIIIGPDLDGAECPDLAVLLRAPSANRHYLSLSGASGRPLDHSWESINGPQIEAVCRVRAIGTASAIEDCLVLGFPGEYRIVDESLGGKVVVKSSSGIKFDIQRAEISFGSAISNIGDLDGDNSEDFAVSALDELEQTAVWAYSGKDGRLLSQFSAASADSSGEAFGSSLKFGLAVCGVSDRTKDGWGEVCIGSANWNQPDLEGSVILFSGRDCEMLWRIGWRQVRSQ